MLIRNIKLQNLLSFGPHTPVLEMGPLNVLIGPNGSGKSNLIEAIGLLQAVPRDLTAPIREGGGIGDWIWRGEAKSISKPGSAQIEVVAENPKGSQPLRYRLGFAERGQRFELAEEQIENESPGGGHDRPYLYFERRGRHTVLNYRDKTQRELRPEEVDAEQSILAQRKDPGPLSRTHLPWRGLCSHAPVPRVEFRAIYATAPAAEGRSSQRFSGGRTVKTWGWSSTVSSARPRPRCESSKRCRDCTKG